VLDLERGLKWATRLVGLSGDRVVLGETDAGVRVVRKAACGVRVDRLLASYFRHLRLAEYLDDSVVIPDVRILDHQEEHILLEMDFLKGKSVVDVLAEGDQLLTWTVTDGLLSLLRQLSNSEDLFHSKPYLRGTDVRSIVEAKGLSLSEELLVRDDPALRNATRLLIAALDRIDWNWILAPTLCHGDLTLENMILVPDGRLALVDISVPVFDHVWSDFSKLDQDLVAGWYRLRLGREYRESTSRYLRDALEATYKDLTPEYPKVRPVLILQNLLRIVPYASGETIDFVRDRVSTFLAKNREVLR